MRHKACGVDLHWLRLTFGKTRFRAVSEVCHNRAQRSAAQRSECSLTATRGEMKIGEDARVFVSIDHSLERCFNRSRSCSFSTRRRIFPLRREEGSIGHTG